MKVVDLEIPVPNDNQILIKVMAAGVNRPDIIQRQGNYPPPENHSPILGLEVSGYIEKIGKNVKNFSLNNKVAALVNGGGYAEFCLAEQESTFKIPGDLSFNEAACIPECYFTAWSNLVQRGKLTRNQKVLIHGGTSGIGIAAIQIAKIFNAKVIATTSSRERMLKAKEIGADYVINYNEESEWWKKVREITNKKGVDIVVEVGGSKTLEQSIKCSKTGAVIGIIGVLSGGIAELPIGRVIYKASRLIGISCGNKIELTNMIEKFNTSNTKPVIDSIFKFSDLPKALNYMSKGKHLGKIAIDFKKK